MGGPTFVIDPAVLRAEAQTLRSTATSLDGAKQLSSPDCGNSSQEVDDLVKRIVEGLTDAARATKALAGALDTASTSFARMDDANAQRFPTAQPGMRPGPTP